MAFLLAGFDTSSSLLCFIAYELSLNTEIQERLQNEIDDVLSKSKENLSYNDLMAMKYLDMVVSGKVLLYINIFKIYSLAFSEKNYITLFYCAEALRKWPPDGHLDRLCADSYILPPPNAESKQSYEVIFSIFHNIYR